MKSNEIQLCPPFRLGTMAMLREFGVEAFVDVVVCGDDYGAKPKPNPYNALMICKILGIAPEVSKYFTKSSSQILGCFDGRRHFG